MKKYILNEIVIFAVGAAIGATIAWKVLEDKYKKIANEEIESVRSMYKRKEELEAGKEIIKDLRDGLDNPDEELSDEVKEHTESSLATLGDIIKHNRYGHHNDKKEEEKEYMAKPYVISPDDFGDLDYETVSLNYYADGVLTDDDDNIIEDIESMVGKDSLNHFGEYEDDSVFVRNDEQQIDYEILLDTRNYYDIYRQ